jgi:hypothetical protein
LPKTPINVREPNARDDRKKVGQAEISAAVTNFMTSFADPFVKQNGDNRFFIGKPIAAKPRLL